MSAILIRDRIDCKAPSDIIEHLALRNPDGFGIMFADKEGLHIHHEYKEGISNDPKQAVEAQDLVSDVPYVMYFRKISQIEGGDNRTGNVQPWLLFHEKGSGAKVGGIFVGDFSMFREEETGSSDAYMYAHKILMPLYSTMARSGLMESKKLSHAVTWPHHLHNAIAGISSSHIILMDQAGKMLQFPARAENVGKEYPWGWTSEIVPIFTSVKAERTAPLASKTTPITVSAKEIYESSALVQEDTHEPSKAREMKLNPMVPQTVKDNLFPTWEEELLDNDKIENEARTLLSKLKPQGEVWPLPGRGTISYEDVREIKMRYLGEHSKDIPGPEFVKKMTEKIPSFTEQVGLKSLSEISHWTPPAIHDLIINHPEAATALIEQMRLELFFQEAQDATEEETPVLVGDVLNQAEKNMIKNVKVEKEEDDDLAFLESLAA